MPSKTKAKTKLIAMSTKKSTFHARLDEAEKRLKALDRDTGKYVKFYSVQAIEIKKLIEGTDRLINQSEELRKRQNVLEHRFDQETGMWADVKMMSVSAEDVAKSVKALLDVVKGLTETCDVMSQRVFQLERKMKAKKRK